MSNRSFNNHELSNHLGNVLTVISDVKLPCDNSPGDQTVDYWVPDIVMSQDYMPFGMTMEGRGIDGQHRFGFQGQEVDNEVKGTGNSVNFKYRMHDPRIGRFFAVDPLARKYPHYTTYSFAGNKVIQYIELEGLEEAKHERREANQIAPKLGMTSDEFLLEANVMHNPATMILLEVGAGFVPILGQGVDIKDTYVAFTTGDSWDQAFAMIAWVPGGDLFKSLRKVLKNVDEFKTFRHTGKNLNLGKKRENLVADLSGGGVAKTADGKDLKIGTLIKGEKIGVTVDVLGENGELITVGGASKANNLGGFGDHLTRLKKVAEKTGVKAQAYLSDNTPQEVIDLARRKLGDDNVKIFKDPE